MATVGAREREERERLHAEARQMSLLREKDFDEAVSHFEARKAKLELRDPDFGWTPLLFAADGGALQLINVLLDRGAKLEASCAEGNTAICVAARQGRQQAVQLLAARKANVDARNRAGWTALLWASMNGHGGVVMALLDMHADFEAADALGRTPLMWASRYGYTAVAEVLLLHGVDFTRRDEDGLNAADHAQEHFELRASIVLAEERNRRLLEAAQRNDVEAARRALEAGAGANVPDDEGWPPLAWAMLLESRPLVEVLVQHGADPFLMGEEAEIGEQLSTKHSSVNEVLRDVLEANERLLVAAHDGNWPLVRKQLEVGAWVNTIDEEERTPLMWAALHGAVKDAALLLNQGAVINARDMAGWTALLFAAVSGSVEVVALLFHHGADFEVRSYHGHSALHLAVRVEDPVMVQVLIAAMMDVNEADYRKRTPLHCAAASAFGSVIQTLIFCNANANAGDHELRTPLMVAVLEEQFKSCEALLSGEMPPPPQLPEAEEAEESLDEFLPLEFEPTEGYGAAPGGALSRNASRRPSGAGRRRSSILRGPPSFEVEELPKSGLVDAKLADSGTLSAFTLPFRRNSTMLLSRDNSFPSETSATRRPSRNEDGPLSAAASRSTSKLEGPSPVNSRRPSRFDSSSLAAARSAARLDEGMPTTGRRTSRYDSSSPTAGRRPSRTRLDEGPSPAATRRASRLDGPSRRPSRVGGRRASTLPALGGAPAAAAAPPNGSSSGSLSREQSLNSQPVSPSQHRHSVISITSPSGAPSPNVSQRPSLLGGLTPSRRRLSTVSQATSAMSRRPSQVGSRRPSVSALAVPASPKAEAGSKGEVGTLSRRPSVVSKHSGARRLSTSSRRISVSGRATARKNGPGRPTSMERLRRSITRVVHGGPALKAQLAEAPVNDLRVKYPHRSKLLASFDRPLALLKAAAAWRQEHLEGDSRPPMPLKSELLNAEDKHGVRALQHAARLPARHIAELLLDSKAEIKAMDLTKTNSLMDAARTGDAEVVELLVAKDADVRARNQEQLRAVDVAANEAVREVLEKADINTGALRHPAKQVLRTRQRVRTQASVAELALKESGPKEKYSKPAIFRVRLECLPREIESDLLRRHIRRVLRELGAGRPLGVEVLVDPITEKPTGVAYVDFADFFAVEAALCGTGKELLDHEIAIVPDLPQGLVY